ncbi:hypothetical protein AA0482_0060 [Acetobacter cibinongensis NRIC 0482]|nr:hypothetical protein AA0482_0060 [Acetobacter cibinongensis NRIC 0482]
MVMSLRIQAEGVQVEHHGKVVVALNYLDMCGPGWFGIIGANGAGKTTLLRAMCGRLPLAAGQFYLGNSKVPAQRQELARHIGFMPDVTHLPLDMSGKDLAKLVAEQLGQPTLALSLAPLRQALGVERFWHRPVGQYSAGMKQRVALYCAFAGGQKLVVLDEPFNWLDPVSLFDVKECLNSMAQQDYLLITTLHEPLAFLQFCKAGMLLESGHTRLVLDESKMAAFKEGSPIDFERYVVTSLRREAKDTV